MAAAREGEEGFGDFLHFSVLVDIDYFSDLVQRSTDPFKVVVVAFGLDPGGPSG